MSNSIFTVHQHACCFACTLQAQVYCGARGLTVTRPLCQAVSEDHVPDCMYDQTLSIFYARLSVP